MNGLNSVLIEGSLTVDPRFDENANGASLCTFTIANERFAQSEDALVRRVSHFAVLTEGRLAEACVTELTKGRTVRVVGRLIEEPFDYDGIRGSRVKIVAEHVEFRPTPKGSPSEDGGESADPLGVRR